MPRKRRDPVVVPVPLDVVRAIADQRRAAGTNARPLDEVRTRLATRQEGMISTLQLRALGYSPDRIYHGVRRGALLPHHRGVYIVGHRAITFRAECIAAQLAAGLDMAIADEAAAHLWTGLPTQPQFVQLVHHSRRPRQREGVRVRVAAATTTRQDGLLVTTAAQTLRDLRHHPQIARITAEALFRNLIDRTEAPTAPTQSRLEDRLLHIIRTADLPEPTTQHQLGPHRVDLCWPDAKLVVEADGDHHRDRFDDDRARDAWLLANGYATLRFTERQIAAPPVVIARIAAALAIRTAANLPAA